MLQNVLASRKAADAVSKSLTFVLVAAFLAKFSLLLLVPLGLVLFGIPLLLIAWLPDSKAGFAYATIVVLISALIELWAYFLFQMVYKVHYGHAFAVFPT